MKTKTYTVVWRYDIGDEVWYFDYSQIRKGVIIEHGITTYSFSDIVEPQYTIKYGEGGYDCWIIKTDYNGVEEWNVTYGMANHDETAYCIKTTN